MTEIHQLFALIGNNFCNITQQHPGTLFPNTLFLSIQYNQFDISNIDLFYKFDECDINLNIPNPNVQSQLPLQGSTFFEKLNSLLTTLDNETRNSLLSSTNDNHQSLLHTLIFLLSLLIAISELLIQRKGEIPEIFQNFCCKLKKPFLLNNRSYLSRLKRFCQDVESNLDDLGNSIAYQLLLVIHILLTLNNKNCEDDEVISPTKHFELDKDDFISKFHDEISTDLESLKDQTISEIKQIATGIVGEIEKSLEVSLEGISSAKKDFVDEIELIKEDTSKSIHNQKISILGELDEVKSSLLNEEIKNRISEEILVSIKEKIRITVEENLVTNVNNIVKRESTQTSDPKILNLLTTLEARVSDLENQIKDLKKYDTLEPPQERLKVLEQQVVRLSKLLHGAAAAAHIRF